MDTGEKRIKAEFDILGKIQFERDKRGWTDYEMSKHSGITQSTICTWFSRRMEPSVASLEKICKGFGISLSQFFFDNTDDYEIDRREIIELWERLTPKQRASMKQFILTLLDKE